MKALIFDLDFQLGVPFYKTAEIIKYSQQVTQIALTTSLTFQTLNAPKKNIFLSDE
jgi:hypothetical protein